MKSNKPPALTSPWKIGFFVSLMLVFVSIGVTYFFVDKSGITWNWQDKDEWLGVLNGQGFLAEILPLLALVALSSLISYMVISSGVRKYRRYLDSGLDYKNLLVSLKDIDDIQDTSKIEKLRHQPELKRLLLNISESINIRVKELGKRESELEKQADAELRAREEELSGEFSRQCEELTQAIENTTAGQMGEELDISDPALKRVEHAVRSAVAAAARDEGTLEFSGRGADDDTSYNELRKAGDVLYRRLEEIVDEMKQSGETAKDIEKQLTELSPAGSVVSEAARADDVGKSSRNLLGTLKTFENLSTSLEVFSEEAKSIAISTALSAGSGEGTQDDLIRLAEEVKDISSRFKESSIRYMELTRGLKETIQELEAAYGGDASKTDPAVFRQSLSTIQTKVALWVERIVVLSDKMANFQHSYSLTVSSLPDADADAPVKFTETSAQVGEMAQEPEDSTEFSFETLERTELIFTDSEEEQTGVAADPAPDIGMFGAMSRDDDGVSGSDDREYSTEAKLEPMAFNDFAETLEEDYEQTEPVEEKVEEKTAKTAKESVEERFPEPVGEADEESVENAVDRPSGPAKLEGFESFARPELPTRPDRREAQVASTDAVGSEPVSPEMPIERTDSRDAVTAKENNVIDLYELGAVDYDPVVHG